VILTDKEKKQVCGFAVARGAEVARSSMSVILTDKEKKQVRGFAVARGAEVARSSMSTPVTLKTEVDSESSRRCMLCCSTVV